MEPEGGGTAFFGGSHRAAAREGDRLVDNANAEGGVGSGVPEWLNAPGPAGHGPGTWVPVDAPGVWRAAGAAGSVIVNYTMTWHTRTPNYSEQPRRIIWIVYKRASEPQPSRYPSVPQDDGQGWGEAKKQWADCKCGGSPCASSFKASASQPRLSLRRCAWAGGGRPEAEAVRAGHGSEREPGLPQAGWEMGASRERQQALSRDKLGMCSRSTMLLNGFG